jgi:hypothetical protein
MLTRVMTKEYGKCHRQDHARSIRKRWSGESIPRQTLQGIPSRNKLKRCCGSMIRGGIKALDWVLRRWYGIYVYSETRDDLLRAAIRTIDVPIILPDGTRVRRGDLVVDLHIWNERVPTLGPLGPSLARASRLRYRIEHSLTALAHHLELRGCLDHCAAVHAEVAVVSGHGARKLARTAERYGLTLSVSRQAHLGSGLLAYGLAWSCNPMSLV